MQQTNFTPAALDGRIVVDGSCSVLPSYDTGFIISTDDYKVFYWSSNLFYHLSSGGVGLSGPISEATIESSVQGFPIRKVETGGGAFAIVFGASRGRSLPSSSLTVFSAENGRLQMWGSNTNGKLGQSSTVATIAQGATTAVSAASGGGNELFIDVALGNYHTVLCGFSGNVYTSGANSLGQLLDGTTTSREAFAAWVSPPGSSRCVAVFATNLNSFVLTSTPRASLDHQDL